MKRTILLLLLGVTSTLCATGHPWRDAQVFGATPAGDYWIRGAVTTYVIPTGMRRSQLHLTLGGSVRAFSDGKNLHVIDNQGKERKCSILREMVNAAADEYLAKEAAKTPEQRAVEQAQRDEIELQRRALRQQALRDLRGQKVDVQVKDCSKNPALCIN